MAQDSPRYAQEFGEWVFRRIEQIKEFPQSGRVVPEFQNEELRELILHKYRIVYRIYSLEQIVILRIVHGAKLLN
ncbi:type II toxin-antitoxin system RelE/ParE family toxin [Reichenbachiella agariperforans]|uniref:type II toxin-antitoxin system RelE/ParE family toxin n=1 Tax=Reichenbachiella agariperforans TaxID=156994 RepID=UPI00093307E3